MLAKACSIMSLARTLRGETSNDLTDVAFSLRKSGCATGSKSIANLLASWSLCAVGVVNGFVALPTTAVGVIDVAWLSIKDVVFERFSGDDDAATLLTLSSSSASASAF